jgi:hypothetical protein
MDLCYQALILLFDLLDDDGAIRHQGRNRANRCQHGQENGANHAQRERNLDQGFAFLVLDDDAANVAPVYQLLDRGHELLTGSLDLLCPSFFLANGSSPCVDWRLLMGGLEIRAAPSHCIQGTSDNNFP